MVMGRSGGIAYLQRGPSVSLDLLHVMEVLGCHVLKEHEDWGGGPTYHDQKAIMKPNHEKKNTRP